MLGVIAGSLLTIIAGCLYLVIIISIIAMVGTFIWKFWPVLMGIAFFILLIYLAR